MRDGRIDALSVETTAMFKRFWRPAQYRIHRCLNPLRAIWDSCHRPKVCNHRCSIACNQYVLRLDISMNQTITPVNAPEPF